MANHNLITVTKIPDVTTKIVTVDLVADGIKINDQVSNLELVINGAEMKGITFLDDGQPLENSQTFEGSMFSIRTPDGTTCVVRNLDDGVATVSQIRVTGSIFADAVLTSAGHIATWAYDAGLASYITRMNLWIAAP